MVSLHLLRHFLDDLLDARGVNAPVQNQALHGFAGDLAPHRVKPGQNHRVGSVIDQHRHPGGGFERANIPAFAANDAAFELLVRQGQGGAGGFEGMFASVALNGHADDPAGLLSRRAFWLPR